MQSSSAEPAELVDFLTEVRAQEGTPSAPAACLNCGAVWSGAYCATCGQERVGRITLGSFAHEVTGQLVEVDRGLLHTFIAMLRRPGAMIREYLQGRRREYTSPVTFVLIASGLSLLRGALTPDASRQLASLQTANDATYRLVYSAAQLDVFHRISDLITTNKFAMDTFLLVPMVLALRFLFRKRGFNLAEIGVFVFYTIGQATLLSVVIGTPLMLVASAKFESGLFIIASIGYLLYAGLGVFGRSFGTAMRLLGSAVLGLILMDGVAFLIPFVVAR